MQTAPNELIQAFEFFKNLLSLVTTALVFWIGRMLFEIRDTVRDHAKDVPELKAGLRNVVDRIVEIERRNLIIDGDYQGPERRHRPD